MQSITFRNTVFALAVGGIMPAMYAQADIDEVAIALIEAEYQAQEQQREKTERQISGGGAGADVKGYYGASYWPQFWERHARDQH